MRVASRAGSRLVCCPVSELDQVGAIAPAGVTAGAGEGEAAASRRSQQKVVIQFLPFRSHLD